MYVERGDVQIEHVITQEMLADMLTKPLSRLLFEKFRAAMNIRDIALLRRSVKMNEKMDSDQEIMFLGLLEKKAIMPQNKKATYATEPKSHLRHRASLYKDCWESS